MLRPDRRWMWTSVALTLLVGACLGVVIDRLLIRPPNVLADQPTSTGPPPWFVCNQGTADPENEPGYLYPERFRKGLLEGLSRDLNLSAIQHRDLEAMLEDARQGARNFWEDSRHAYCDIRDAFRSSIREILSPDQRVDFDHILAALDQKNIERAARSATPSAESR